MGRLRDAIRASAVGDLQEGGPGEAAQDFVFAEDFLGFDGHFPGYSILPAMVQVQTAQLLAEAAYGRRLTLGSISHAKFLLQLRPGMRIRVGVRERQMAGRTVSEGRLETAEGVAASFVMMFAGQEAS